MIKIVALDLDGTLTQHKSRLESECRNVLSELSEKYKLVMVCAGGCERVFKQMNGFKIDIIGFYGMEYSEIKNDKIEITKKIKVEEDKTKVAEKVEQLRQELGFTEYYGESVEFHESGMITFPIIGTMASLDKKLAFDPDRTIRRKYYNRVCKLFEEYNVFIGGSSSFDIAPKPYCKLYALEQYLNTYGIDKSEIIFFGDDYGVGGNDSDVYNSDIKFIPIDDYREFSRIAKEELL